MINFPCRCGYQFSVTADLAGGTIQCPKCRRLNDVPLLSDLHNIDDQGIYKLDANPAKPRDDAARLHELTYAFTRDHYDAQGRPIDLRPTPQESLRGPQPLPPEQDPTHSGVGGLPKYDPVTGELLRPMDVAADMRPDADSPPPARVAPVPPRTVVNGMDVPAALEVFAIPFRLFKPVNFIVMAFILLAQALAQGMMIFIGAFFLLPAPFWLAVQALIVAHFGNVIDETGPASHHELPAPLRSVSYDDTVGSFLKLLAAAVICYGPGLLLLINTIRVPAQAILTLSAALLIIGTILFPAAALTLMTSGSVLNVRPDRLVGVVLACGAEYVVAVLTWVTGGALYFAGAIAVNWIAAGLLQMNAAPRPPRYVNGYLAYAALGAGIYILHFLCWHLGTLYRRHHERFPWVFQRHIYEHRHAESAGFPVSRSGASAVRSPTALGSQRPTPLGGMGRDNADG